MTLILILIHLFCSFPRMNLVKHFFDKAQSLGGGMSKVSS